MGIAASTVDAIGAVAAGTCVEAGTCLIGHAAGAVVVVVLVNAGTNE